ncbi:hypothetical protein CUMW_115910 [Citrus unshiu]|uniref:Uncharacterized protein n=1 Tax=Citrus unshiu TaxID=55188 RepID=A0A2H5P9F4_CITUN|nr:hypothetical protein CUMW_115910 [Citrus unshiu]
MSGAVLFTKEDLDIMVVQVDSCSRFTNEKMTTCSSCENLVRLLKTRKSGDGYVHILRMTTWRPMKSKSPTSSSI